MWWNFVIKVDKNLSQGLSVTLYFVNTWGCVCRRMNSTLSSELLAERERGRDVGEGREEAVPRRPAEGGGDDGQEQVQRGRAEGGAGGVRGQEHALLRSHLCTQHARWVGRRCPLFKSKVALYRDTGSADPGSAAIFVSVSVSEIHILCIALAKDTFSFY